MADNRRAVLLAVAAATALTLLRGAAPASAAATTEACGRGSASLQPILKIINTRDANFDCVAVTLDERANIRAFRFEKHDGDVARRPPNAAPANIHTRDVTPAEMASDRGAVLDGVPGHDAVMLRGDLEPAQSSVPLVLSFLYNGFTGEYRACNTTLTRGPDRRWRLIDGEQRPISLVVVKTRVLPLIGTVGIETLQGICAARG